MISLTCFSSAAWVLLYSVLLSCPYAAVLVSHAARWPCGFCSTISMAGLDPCLPPSTFRLLPLQHHPAPVRYESRRGVRRLGCGTLGGAAAGASAAGRHECFDRRDCGRTAAGGRVGGWVCRKEDGKVGGWVWSGWMVSYGLVLTCKMQCASGLLLAAHTTAQ